MLIILVLGPPILIWLVSYIYLAFYHKGLNLFNINIHESGKYTLTQTIFFVDHFLRELLIDTFFVFCAYWGIRNIDPETSITFSLYQKQMICVLFLLLIGAVITGSVRKVGLKETILDIFQFRETDDDVGFGFHWQMHFLSSIFLMLLFILPGTISRGIVDKSLYWVIAGFIVLSIVFRTGIKSVTDRRWLMHGAREILTFFLLAVIPYYSFLFYRTNLKIYPFTFTFIVLSLLILGLAAYFMIIYLKSDISNLSRAKIKFDQKYLIASHFFEHVLDIFYMALLMIVLFSNQ